MSDIIERYFDEVIVVIFVIMALTAFFTINTSFNAVSKNTISDTHVYRESISEKTYVGAVSGAEVIKTIMGDRTGITFEIYDSATPENHVATLINCDNLSLLTMIHITSTYNTTYIIIGDTITTINYTEN